MTQTEKPFQNQNSKQLYAFTEHEFTTCGEIGNTGPNITHCKDAYSNVSWAQNSDFFDIEQEGYQEWTVPEDGTYRIEAHGARGGLPKTNIFRKSDSRPGKGAYLEAEFELKRGEVIYIAVGQQGGNGHHDNHGGGGGGGTFIVRKMKGYDYSTASVSHILAIAAGGAGAYSEERTKLGGHGLYKGRLTESMAERVYADSDRSGGGFINNGNSKTAFRKTRQTVSWGGQSFRYGLIGGNQINTQFLKIVGGFGGGAAEFEGSSAGAGGFFGGERDGVPEGDRNAMSFISGKNLRGQTGENSGDGRVIIRFLENNEFKQCVERCNEANDPERNLGILDNFKNPKNFNLVQGKVSAELRNTKLSDLLTKESYSLIALLGRMDTDTFLDKFEREWQKQVENLPFLKLASYREGICVCEK